LESRRNGDDLKWPENESLECWLSDKFGDKNCDDRIAHRLDKELVNCLVAKTDDCLSYFQICLSRERCQKIFGIGIGEAILRIDRYANWQKWPYICKFGKDRWKVVTLFYTFDYLDGKKYHCKN
jgi:hypothetical protein